MTERRHQILRAAERLLERYGPAKTTMADVAREADIGVGTVYLEFPSKHAIVEELSRARHEAVLSAMKAQAELSGGRFRDRLAGLFDARTEALLRLAEEGAHACDLVHCQSTPVQAAQECYAREEQKLVENLVRQGVEAGEFVASRPDLTARAILCAYICFAPPNIFAVPREEIMRDLRAMHQLVLEGLLVRTSP